MTPSNEQAAAIRRIVEWHRDRRGPQEFYVAGYAGVGKSVTANAAIRELREKCGVRNVRTAAYTGKAALVLRKKGVDGAQTIHSLIYTAVEDEETGEVHFVLSPESAAADADLIVLD
ncbi:MAG TPA: AAA family ATPase, partial [Urbifossiella sp.]|nr:AAA family ATPase [Urbifossiella sp.]